MILIDSYKAKNKFTGKPFFPNSKAIERAENNFAAPKNLLGEVVKLYHLQEQDASNQSGLRKIASFAKSIWRNFNTKAKLTYTEFFLSNNIAYSFNTESNNSKFLSFTEAKDFIRSLQGKGVGISDQISHRVFVAQIKNKNFQREINLNGQKYTLTEDEYLKAIRLPSNPNLVYKQHGWKGLRDYLGTERSGGAKAKECLPFHDAKKFIQELRARGIDISDIETYRLFWQSVNKQGLKSFVLNEKSVELTDAEFAKVQNLPSAAIQYYQDEWISIGDFLGTGRVANKLKEFISFEEAQACIRSLRRKGVDLRTQAAYFEFVRSIQDSNCFELDGCKYVLSDEELAQVNSLPKTPTNVYAKQWTNWKSYLGTTDTKRRRKRMSSKSN